MGEMSKLPKQKEKPKGDKPKSDERTLPRDQPKPVPTAGKGGLSAQLREKRAAEGSPTAKSGPLRHPEEDVGKVGIGELLDRLADKLDEKADRRARTDGKKSGDGSDKSAATKLREHAHTLKDGKMELQSRADWKALDISTSKGADRARGLALSPDERAERQRVTRPEGGIGFYHSSAVPAAGHLDKWLAEIGPEQRTAIKEGKAELIITGFASRSGDRQSNQPLSEARARAVADQLELRGIDRSNIHHYGVGEDLAKLAGRPDNKDNAQDRIVMIDVVPKVEPQRQEKLKVTPDEASRVVSQLLSPFPVPLARDMLKEAKNGLFNPLSLIGIAKLGVNGVKHWLESNDAARRNFAASADFIPAFMGRIESLTTGQTRISPLRANSAEAAMGRKCADSHFIALPEEARVKLVALMNDDKLRGPALQQMEYDLRRRFIEK
jgi:flagellar motor protein MotB